jgi:hypothetical protein
LTKKSGLESKKQNKKTGLHKAELVYDVHMKATTNNKEEKMSVTVTTPRTVKILPTREELEASFHEAVLNANREFDLYYATDYTCHYAEAQNWKKVAITIAKKISRNEYV